MLNSVYSDTEVFPPFAPIAEQRTTHITYLDTIGRPAVTLSFKNLTDKHNGLIYVSSRMPQGQNIECH
jgi:oligosaccharyltransferase complex subunit alpha (ribophorin I)